MKTLTERFWSKVNKNGPIHPKLKTRCWVWTGSVTKDGYGRLVLPTKGTGWPGIVLAHRFSYEIHKGPIPPGLFVCHHCDNRPCTRPGHFFLGANVDNIADATDKGRMAPHNRRKTHCKNGHAFDKENTYQGKSRGRPVRYCRACARTASREFQRRLRRSRGIRERGS